MITHVLGFPRIGANRELKKAVEQYWSGKLSRKELLEIGKIIRKNNWFLQQKTGLKLIASNDFSFYDQVLDTILLTGAMPKRYHKMYAAEENQNHPVDTYFAMARGVQKKGFDIPAMEMTKWFDTNYHYIVPELSKKQVFKLSSPKIFDEFTEAKTLGILSKPVLLGPVSFLLSGKEKEEQFHRLDLLDKLLPVYNETVKRLLGLGAQWIQFDEPFLVTDIDTRTKEAYSFAYSNIAKKGGDKLKILLATYFGGLGKNLKFTMKLPFSALHLDLVRDPGQLDEAISELPSDRILSLGLVDGRNIWRNNLDNSLSYIEKAKAKLGENRIMISSSCSLLHSPCDLDGETEEKALPSTIKNWMAFAKQKVEEVVILDDLVSGRPSVRAIEFLTINRAAVQSRKNSPLTFNKAVRDRISSIVPSDYRRKNPFTVRKQKQQEELHLPLFPTTTIGSFPQTKEVRAWRALLKSKEITPAEYEKRIKNEITNAIHWQESIGLDVLVHGEFERNDMVEYFGELLEGFAFTKNGWVQSYGSRCVKPPVIYGDLNRPREMTTSWSSFAQSLTKKPVKGMLTGPVTILQWSFVRDDQPRSETCRQIALAIRDEVCDLEKAGIKVIQIDEPALREGLPLCKSEWKEYLDWAVNCFRLSASGVNDGTQIHTHMCYSEFNDIIGSIAGMDADVISIESSRSQMELLNAFFKFKYPNDIGPGVYDIHSPRIPSMEEMVALLEKAISVLKPGQIWVNPDCGLKTRGWEETKQSLINLVKAANAMRKNIGVNRKKA
ncbi:MAG: 5-methyltetrahydropteroyltriglutamate--homocysteine S-methyltransferase [Bacteroidetes bacterium]|nr:5-methyltetrahydropteroyltriglutamate--homocysteine S-methyltransferase [Bacteroidota bacterium]